MTSIWEGTAVEHAGAVGAAGGVDEAEDEVVPSYLSSLSGKGQLDSVSSKMTSQELKNALVAMSLHCHAFMPGGYPINIASHEQGPSFPEALGEYVRSSMHWKCGGEKGWAGPCAASHRVSYQQVRHAIQFGWTDNMLLVLLLPRVKEEDVWSPASHTYDLQSFVSPSPPSHSADEHRGWWRERLDYRDEKAVSDNGETLQ
jgi:hypothetical protein